MRATLPLGLVTLLVLELANARAYDPSLARLALATATTIALLGLAVAWARVPSRRGGSEHLVRVALAAPLATGAFAIHARGMLAPGPLQILGVLAALGLVAVGIGALRARVLVVLGGALGAGLALRAYELFFTPIDARRADMLPLVVAALGEVGSGAAPYRMYQMPWDVPLTYLPLNWLAYGPALVLGVDVRWTNAAAEVAVLGAVLFAGRRRPEAPGVASAIGLWSAWFASTATVLYDGNAAAAVQWAALAWLVALAIELHPATPVVAGLALATTPLAAPLLPVLALAWARGREHPAAGRRPRRSLARAITITAVVASVLVVPWALASPRGFLDGVVLWFNDLDRFPRKVGPAWVGKPGLSGLFWAYGLERLLKPLQIASVLAVFAATARALARVRVRRVVGPSLVATSIVFLAWNPVVWGYLWYAPAALVLVVLTRAEGPRPPR